MFTNNCDVNVTKYNAVEMWLSGVFFQAPNTPKVVFGRGSARNPLGELTTLPQTPIVGWGGGHPLPIPFPFDAFGVSISATSALRVSGPPTQIPGYAYVKPTIL